MQCQNNKKSLLLLSIILFTCIIPNKTCVCKGNKKFSMQGMAMLGDFTLETVGL